MSLRDERTCVHCHQPIGRNPDTKKVKWLHKLGGGKKCNDDRFIATPMPVHVNDDIIMVEQNNIIYRRDKYFFPEVQSDLWSSWIQGSSPVTIDFLLDRGDVYVVKKLEKL